LQKLNYLKPIQIKIFMGIFNNFLNVKITYLIIIQKQFKLFFLYFQKQLIFQLNSLYLQYFLMIYINLFFILKFGLIFNVDKLKVMDQSLLLQNF